MKDFWELVDARIDERIGIALDPALRNHRPRGNAPVVFCVGSPGVTLAADVSNEWMHVYVPFPGIVQRAEIKSAAPGGTGTFDIWMEQPGQTLSQAATIFGVNPLVLDNGSGGAAREKTIKPSSDWTTYIPAGSTLLLFVTAASGLTVVTINLILKCV